MVRISIAGLLGFVVAFALGLAALISGTDLWRGVACTLTLAVLLGSVLGIVLRGWRDGGLLGFALFGWGYLLMALMASGMADHLRELSDPLARWVFESSNIPPVAPPPAPPSSPGIILGSRMGNQQMTDYQSEPEGERDVDRPLARRPALRDGRGDPRDLAGAVATGERQGRSR
jgi:hypothetical protein